MTALTPFTYTDTEVRTVTIDGEPWFVAKDVCDVIGISKPRDAFAQLDEDERASTAVDTLGGTQNMSIVNEAGVYGLMLISRSPAVKPFKRWLTHEVLPQIRKTGQYGTALPTSFAEALELAAAKQREIEAAETALAIAAPKVEAFDDFMESDGTYTLAAAAKSLADVTGGVGRNTLMSWLRDHGVLMRDNTPYQRYAHWFKVAVSTYERAGTEHATRTTYVRPAGLDGIRQMWKRSAQPPPSPLNGASQ
jgi:anti-repressor protein